MKSLAGILGFLFLLSGLLPHNDFCELRKLPALYEHYLEHLQEDGDSFFEFVYEDFLSKQGDKDGHHNKPPIQDLPFQNHTFQSHCCNFFPIVNTFKIHHPDVSTNTYNNEYAFHYSYLYLNTIFQPPRV